MAAATPDTVDGPMRTALLPRLFLLAACVALAAGCTDAAPGPTPTSGPTSSGPGGTFAGELAYTVEATDLVWSPDGATLAVTDLDSGVVEIRDATSGTVQRSFGTGAGWLAWSPDGTRLATVPVGQGAVTIWDAATGTVVHELQGETTILPFAASWSPDGRWLAVVDFGLQLWDADTGTLAHEFEGDFAVGTNPVWSPDSTRVAAQGSLSATEFGGAYVWDVTTGEPVPSLQTERGFIDWSPDGTKVVTLGDGSGFDGAVNILDAETGAALRTFDGAWHDPRWSPDGTRIVAAGGDDAKTAMVWDATTGTEIHTLAGHGDTVGAAYWSPDGTRIATDSLDNSVRVWDSATGELAAELTDHEGYIVSVVWSSDGRWLATSDSNDTYRVWH